MPGADLATLPARQQVLDRANATLLEREDLTAEVAILRIAVDGGTPIFQPGQYFALGLPIDGKMLQRPYSAASPSDGLTPLEFLVRRVPTGALTPRLWELRTGARLRVGRPKGLFTLDPRDDRDHLLLATGTGLAPFISMFGALERGAHPPRVVLVHGVAQVPELAYRDRLEGRSIGRFAYHPVVSRPWLPVNARWTGASGRLDAFLARGLDALELGPDTSVAYVCGNPGMIAGVVPLLGRLGLAATSIHVEEYWSSASDLVA